KKVLVLGHGENIYIPSRVASYIKGDVKFKTTTRSPIYCKEEDGYPIKEKHAFYDRGVKYYFYNKAEIESIYDKVVFLTETDLNIKLTDNIEIFKL
ncbi:TRSP domain-containing protein, partial [uncultured Clostridium sp.]|uniref:TRSP domain-containing protein n=1 Tax=uncultured Clostridium sp. TaxID=59620 RepID=UPI002613A8F0